MSTQANHPFNLVDYSPWPLTRSHIALMDKESDLIFHFSMLSLYGWWA